MSELRKWGGLAALVAAATYVVGFALFFTVLEAAGYGAKGTEPLRSVEFLVGHQGLMHAWNLTIYVINSIVVAVLALALHDCLANGSPALARAGAAFGLIWAALLLASGMLANVGMQAVVDLHASDPAQSAVLWRTMVTVEEGLGGGNELAGALWILLVSSAAFRTRQLPRALNVLGVAIGVSGLLTLVPPLALFGAIFGLGFIVWFAWVGVALLRPARS